jgi:hypothetical protein
LEELSVVELEASRDENDTKDRQNSIPSTDMSSVTKEESNILYSMFAAFLLER